MDNCVFCKIVRGEIPCYKIWEDDYYLAFLSIEPTVQGLTLVIPKTHQPSYFVNVNDNVLIELMKGAKIVSKILDVKLEGVIRTKLVFEGLEIDHLHAKLYPMYKKGFGRNKATPESLQNTLTS